MGMMEAVCRCPVTCVTWGYGGMGEEAERKLVKIPLSVTWLRMEVRRFEEERGCKVTAVLAGPEWFLRVGPLAREMGLTARLDREVRPGHVVLVGE